METFTGQDLPIFKKTQSKKPKPRNPKVKDYIAAGVTPPKSYRRDYYLKNKERLWAKYVRQTNERRYREKPYRYMKQNALSSLRMYFKKLGLYKTCIKCGETKTLADFDYRRAPDTRKARHSICKKCRAKHNHEMYLKRKQQNKYNEKGYIKDDNTCNRCFFLFVPCL